MPTSRQAIQEKGRAELEVKAEEEVQGEPAQGEPAQGDGDERGPADENVSGNIMIKLKFLYE